LVSDAGIFADVGLIAHSNAINIDDSCKLNKMGRISLISNKFLPFLSFPYD
jgi:hypothetical protein